MIDIFPMEKFLAMIDRHEADRLDIYPDSRGIWTTGRGFNMEQVGARDVCRSCGIDYDATMALKGTRKPAITETQSLALFNHCVNELLPVVRRLIPKFDQLSENRQLAIMDVAWAGIGTLEGFHQMLAAIRREDWNAAAADLLNSRYAKDVGHRAIGNAEMLRTGYPRL
jgi:lysozyme